MVPSPPHRVAVAGMCPEHWMQLQSRKSHKAGRGVNTLPWTPSLVWQVRQMKPCPTPKQEIPWLEGNPCQGRAVPGNTLPVVFRSQPHGRSSTKCLPGAGCQNSSWATPPAGASAPSHTSSHQPLKGCERWGGYVASRIKAVPSSLPCSVRQRLSGHPFLCAFSPSNREVHTTPATINDSKCRREPRIRSLT